MKRIKLLCDELMACALVWILALISCAHGADEDLAPAPVTGVLDALKKNVESLKLEWTEQGERPSPSLLNTPILRCNDPTRAEMDGAVWLWLDGKRPVTALCLLKYAGGKSNYELVSLCDEPLKLTGRPNWSWEPIVEKRSSTRLDGLVPKTQIARQIALREFARQLEATEFYKGQRFALRLLNRPLYSYSDEEHGVLEGAIFALANGTNPEILVQIEACHEDSNTFRLSCARMASAALTVKLDDKELWTVEAIDPRDPTRPYFATNELPEKQ